MSEKQEWYEIVDDDKNVFQGDFLNSCPVIIPQEKLEESKSITAKVDLYNDLTTIFGPVFMLVSSHL